MSEIIKITDRISLILEGESATVECHADDPIALAQADAIVSMLRIQGARFRGAEYEDANGHKSDLLNVLETAVVN